MKLTREEIYEQIKDSLVTMFEIDAASVTPEADFSKDLDIDSLDAVGLLINLENVTGKQFEPQVFKNVRTVDDAVDALYKSLEPSP